MKKVYILLCILAIATSSLGAEEIKIKCNSVYPETSLAGVGLKDFAELVKQYTNGKVVIEVHTGASLGFKGPELLSVVKEGVVPMSDILMGVVQDSERVFGLPFMPRIVTTYDEAFSYYNGAKPLYDKAAEKWNQKILYVFPWPPTGLFTKQEIKSIGDLKGMKIRVYDKNIEKLFTLLQANPVMLSWADVPKAVKEGTVEAVLTTAATGLGANFHETFKYFMPLNLDFPINMVTINLKTWNALSQEQKTAIEKAAREIQSKQWERSKADNSEAVKNLIAKGMIISIGGGANSENRYGIKVMAETGVLITTLDKEFQAELDRASRKVIEDFIAISSEDIANFLRSYLASKKK